MNFLIKYGKIMVIALFLVIILLPAIQMQFKVWEVSALEEKRPKAKVPDLSSKSLINGTFMTGFEQFFNDHFGFRDRLIKLSNKADMYVFRVSANAKVILGKEDFLFFAETLNDYNKQPTLSDEAIQELAHQIFHLQHKVERNGMVFLFIVGPNKNTIYPEYMPQPSQNKQGQSNYDKLVLHLRELGVNHLDLVSVLNANKSRYQLYSKRDTHWNQTAGVIVSQQIISYFNKRLGLKCQPPVIAGFETMPEGEVDGYDLNTMLGLDKYVKTSRGRPIITMKPAADQLPGVLWYGDSFSGVLTPIIRDYSTSFTFYHYDKNQIQNNLVNFTHDKKIVVFEIVERAIPHLGSKIVEP